MKLLNRLIGEASVPLEFITANGPARADTAVGLRSDTLGPHIECNILKDAPFCASMGQLIMDEYLISYEFLVN